MKTTVGLYLAPIVGVLFAAVFLGERVTLMSVAGGALIIGGVIIDAEAIEELARRAVTRDA